MFDVVALGDLLIDFTPCGKSENNMPMFEQNAGGATANVLSVLANFGLKTAFIGKVGKDMHGDFLRETLYNKNIDVSGLLQTPDVYTTLAFVSLSDSGERSFSFSRKPGADTCLEKDDINPDAFKSVKVFHFGSLSLTDEPARSATFEAIKIARAEGAIISYDPNYRAPLWKNKEYAIEHMRSVLNLIDVIKISDEETELLTGESEPEKAAEALKALGIKCVVVTLGANGAFVSNALGSVQVAPPKCNVVDTTGAGDAFCGAFIYKIFNAGKPLSEITPDELKDMVCFANVTAALCVGKRGAIPAMPMLDEVLEMISKQ